MYEAEIEAAAKANKISPTTLRKFINIESGWNADAQTGSHKGLLQLTDQEFKDHGGGDIFNPADNINAGAKLIAAKGVRFQTSAGRPATDHEMYMAHQQGEAGAAAHASNPEGVAWQNVAKYYPSERMAKSAIWGNLPEADKARFGNVDNVTSGAFSDVYKRKVNGDDSPVPTDTGPATSVTTTKEQPPADGVPSERATDAFDAIKTQSPADKVADLESHLSGMTAQQAPGAAPSPATVAAMAGQVGAGIGGPAAAPAAAAATPAAAPGVNPYLLAQPMQPQQTPAQPQNALAAIANPVAADSSNTQNMLRLMAMGRDKNNTLASLNGNGVIS